MRFTKMEGLGNDYVYLNCMEEAPEDLPELARRLSHRHFGVGADGLICIRPGIYGDFTMEMYNADGSRGAMCGNGIRCVGKYVYDKGLTKKTCLTIDTDAGERQLELVLREGMVDQVTVDLGAAVCGSGRRMALGDRCRMVYPVSMGNPHAVILCDDPAAAPVETEGPLLERHQEFSPQGTNVEFVTVRAVDELEVRVWERGSGVTLACGTGACAAFAAVWKLGLCADQVRTRLPGGTLTLRRERKNGHIFMTGPARTVFEGEFEER